LFEAGDALPGYVDRAPADADEVEVRHQANDEEGAVGDTLGAPYAAPAFAIAWMAARLPVRLVVDRRVLHRLVHAPGVFDEGADPPADFGIASKPEILAGP
jgi:hypothetical protein